MLPTVTIDLPFLAREVNDAHSQVQYHAKGMLLEAKRAGEALIAAKKQCLHGMFKDWVAANCRCSYPNAHRYMQVAKKAINLPRENFEAMAEVSIREFLGRTETPQEPAPAAPAPAPSFTREDAEYTLKIHARVERGQDGERDVAATKLAKVAEADFVAVAMG